MIFLVLAKRLAGKEKRLLYHAIWPI